MKRALVFAAFVLAVAGAILACLDMTPYVVPPAEDASPPPPPIVDAGPDAPDVDTRHPCQRCIENPDDAGGCGDELAACLNDPACNATYRCVVSKGCLDKPNTTQTTICGLPCLAEAGIFDLTSQSALLAIAVVNCGELSCKGICVPEAGVVAFDGGVD